MLPYLRRMEKAMNKALFAPEFSSYTENQVHWLLKDLSEVPLEAPTEDREEGMQNGGHYSESLPMEYVPGAEYTELFKESLRENARKLAAGVGVLSEQLLREKGKGIVLASLARAGTPVGILIKEYLKEYHSIDAPHYAISIIRGKGIDENALRYIGERHPENAVIFIDGWTGKGAITREIADAIKLYNSTFKANYSSDVAVLADPGHCVRLYGTREDYLIPSACLNSTVSGLISRTVLRDDLIGPGDFHGAKFYREYMESDLSQFFIQEIVKEYDENLAKEVALLLASHNATAPTWSGWESVEKISEEYGINNVNLVKPGVGETTRVLLRRVPWKILVDPAKRPNLRHILVLAEERGVTIEERADMPYSAIGLIHPKYNKGATGADGRGV